jgi:hypothetical protein
MFRVLPPVKTLAEKNKIAQYWSIIWLTDTQNRKRPVSSVLRKQKGVILQDDPILTRYEQMQAELDAAMKSGAPEIDIQILKENIKRIMPKKFYAVNVLSASGELGVLELPYTSYQNFENRLRELYAQGIDAVGIGPDKGVFFDFKRLQDERGKTVYPVDVATKTTKDQYGNFVVTYIRSPLSEEEAASLASRAEDLTKLFTEYSYEAMQALATLSQQAFDAVFQKPQNVEPENDTEVSDETQEELAQYKAANQQQILNPIAQNAAPKPQNLGSTFGPASMPTQTLTPTSSLSNKNVMNNAKVKNFLFPDKKG